MILTEIQLSNFRNHTDTKLQFSKKINIVSGNNGQGKTNLLEAISYSCLTKSMFSAKETETIQYDKNWFTVFSTFSSDIGFTYKNQIRYDKEKNNKNFLINNINIEPMSSVVGKFPLVFLYPELSVITSGGPQERRRFLDLLLSQTSKTYLENLIDYRKIVKQRNNILLNPQQREVDEVIEPWNELLIERGSKIIEHRIKTIEDFKPHLEKIYSEISSNNEAVEVKYISSIGESEPKNIKETRSAFREKIQKTKKEEFYRGTTLVGPHRDDLFFKLNGHPLRQFASQGQHKTFLISLKLAEYFFIEEVCHETPILLLDDVLSELDFNRSGLLLDKLTEVGQAFITTTIPKETDFFKSLNAQSNTFLINNGSLVAELN